MPSGYVAGQPPHRVGRQRQGSAGRHDRRILQVVVPRAGQVRLERGGRDGLAVVGDVDDLDERARGATICPSEAARSVDPDGWQALMEPARCAARRLVAAGEVQITQAGRVVDPSSCKGPIRIRRIGG